MEIQARLVHAEPGRRVVQVRALQAGQPLGSALGEAASAEEAEDRALARLRQRLEAADRSTAGPPPTASSPAPARPEPPEPPEPAEPDEPLAPATKRPTPQPPATPEPPPSPAPPEPPADPEDWSTELAQLDLELKRLGWGRDEESVFLQRAFGHPSRSRLTTYADLLAYLRGLGSLEPGADPAVAAVPLRRSDLLTQGEQLLDRLGWPAEQGRRFLQERLGVTSRQKLADDQLLRFNMLLEEELLASP
jgi:hypothetical protein